MTRIQRHGLSKSASLQTITFSSITPSQLWTAAPSGSCTAPVRSQDHTRFGRGTAHPPRLAQGSERRIPSAHPGVIDTRVSLPANHSASHVCAGLTVPPSGVRRGKGRRRYVKKAAPSDVAGSGTGANPNIRRPPIFSFVLTPPISVTPFDQTRRTQAHRVHGGSEVHTTVSPRRVEVSAPRDRLYAA